MGLGKTYQTIGIINHLIAYNEIDKILILVPVEGLQVWVDEFKKFATFDIDYENDIYIATSKNRKPFQSSHKICIMTPDTFRMLSDEQYKLQNKGKKSGLRWVYCEKFRRRSPAGFE